MRCSMLTHVDDAVYPSLPIAERRPKVGELEVLMPCAALIICSQSFDNQIVFLLGEECGLIRIVLHHPETCNADQDRCQPLNDLEVDVSYDSKYTRSGRLENVQRSIASLDGTCRLQP